MEHPLNPEQDEEDPHPRDRGLTLPPMAPEKLYPVVRDKIVYMLTAESMQAVCGMERVSARDLSKYAHQVYNPVQNRFIEYRGIGAEIANQILMDAELMTYKEFSQ